MSKNNVLTPDNLYADQLDTIDSFTFNQQVVDVFPDMIQRSIPGYTDIIAGIADIADYSTPPNGLVYDLGCSLGAVSLSIAKKTFYKKCAVIGVDNSEAMVKRCRQHVSAYSFAEQVSIQHCDINALEFKPAHVIVLNFTLQFIVPEHRLALITKLYAALAPGGVLILSEKIRHENALINETLVDLHHDFKRKNGYSDLEISQKRSALEKVMLVDTVKTHYQRFELAGFEASSLWFQHLNFVSFMAVKQR